MYRTDPVIKRQILKTRQRRIAVLIQIIYFKADCQFYFISILFFETREFRKVIIHPIPFHCPCSRERQRGMRRNAIGSKAFADSKADKIFHIGPSVAIQAMTMIIGQVCHKGLCYQGYLVIRIFGFIVIRNSTFYFAEFQPAHSLFINQVIHFRQSF